MTEPTLTEKLTTRAASSESHAVELVRSTLGPLFLLMVMPPAAILFWIVCTFAPFDGSLLPLLTAEGWRSVAEHFLLPSLAAAKILLVFVVLQASSWNGCRVSASTARSRRPAIGRATSSTARRRG
jgi:hypothetical protein